MQIPRRWCEFSAGTLAAGTLVVGVLGFGLAGSSVASAGGEERHGAEPGPDRARAVSERGLTPSEVEAFLDEYLGEQLSAEHVVGATASVVDMSLESPHLALAKGYGFASLDPERPVDAANTLFFIGSDGKLFTWTAVMQLVDEGLIDLHADVSRYLDFPIPMTFEDPITLHHLMTHTAGFEEQLDALLVTDETDVQPLDDFLKASLPRRIYPPGEIFAYSNYGAALAGYIVQRVSGLDYADYVESRIMEPLAMSRSTARKPPSNMFASVSLGYRWTGAAYDASELEWVAAAPAGGVRSTATDMARFAAAHLAGGCLDGGCILSDGAAGLMQARQFSHDPRIPGMAYGWVESKINDRRVLWHMGESPRFTTVLALVPEEGAGLFVSYNTPPADGAGVLYAFMDRFFPAVQVGAGGDPLDGWADRLGAREGTYVSSRVSRSSPQKIVGWFDSLEVRVDAPGALQVGTRRYIEVEPGLFREIDGPRWLTFDERLGAEWMFWGPFAYFKVPWYSTLAAHFAVLAFCALVFASGPVLWPIANAWHRRRGDALSLRTRPVRWVAGMMGLVSTGLFGWLLVPVAGYAETYVFPSGAVRLIASLFWLLVPLLAATVLLFVQETRSDRGHRLWRIHYALYILAGILTLAIAAHWNLIMGI